MQKTKQGKTSKQITRSVYLSSDLLRRIERIADAQHRSANQQIVLFLTAAVSQRDT